jgi:hypothetical protein
MDEMTMDDLLNELQGLVDKYKADDGTDTEPTEQDAERMSALTAEIEKRNAAAAQRRDSHTATVAAARAAIENGTARRVDSVPLGTSASARGALPTGARHHRLQRRRPPRVGEGHCQPFRRAAHRWHRAYAG